MGVVGALKKEVVYRFRLRPTGWASVVVHSAEPVKELVEWDVSASKLEDEAGHFSRNPMITNQVT